MTWRVIMTDSESLSGVAPVCDRQDDPASNHHEDGQQLTDWVYDCCPGPHLECWGEREAAELAGWLNGRGVEPCS